MPDETAALQALGQQAQAIAISSQQFDDVATANRRNRVEYEGRAKAD
jgi:hypothetical protein